MCCQNPPRASPQPRRSSLSRHDFSLPLNRDQRSKRLNPARKFLCPVDRINNQPRALSRAWIPFLASAHFFAQHIQCEPAGRHFCPRHLFHGAIRLRNRCPISLSLDAHLVRAKISHRNGICFLRNLLQQRPIFRSIAHHLPWTVQPQPRLDQIRSCPLAYKVTPMSAQANTGTVLDRILDARRAAVDHRKRVLPEAALKYGAKAATPLRDFAAALARDGLNILAELKPASPSRGVLREPFDAVALARSLEAAGSAALSILTEEEFFHGSLKHLREARKSIALPVLRKDFIFDPWQVWETRANDAHSYLLVLAALDDAQLTELIALGRQLGMEPLVEVHTRAELDRALAADARILGVNNRDLKTLSVRVETSYELIDRIPDHCIAVSESGLRSHDDLVRLPAAGFAAFLIAEHLMLPPDPAAARAELLGTTPPQG